jgi:signal transduction histidine kinase
MWGDLQRNLNASMAHPHPSRPLEGRHALLLALTLAVVYGAQAAAGYAWTSIGNGLAAIWLGNGILAAGLVLLPLRLGLPLLAAATAMDISSALWIGRVPPAPAILVIGMDQIEAVLAASLVRRFGGAGIDPTRMRATLVLLLACILPATLAAGSLGSFLSKTMGQQVSPELWFVWVAGDFLGMTLSLPATLLLSRPRRHRVLPAAADPMNLGIVVLVLALTYLFASLPGPRGISLLIVVGAFLASFKLPTALVMLMNLGIVVICTLQTMAISGFAARWQDDDVGRFLLLQFLTLPIATCTLLGAALLSDRARQERHLRRALLTARDAQHRAMAANRVKARFLASMSHEMRTPLNSIMGHAELMERATDLPPPEVRRARQIRTSSETLSQLIDDVLDFTQIDGGRIEIQHADFDLGSLCRDALMAAQVLAAGKPIEFMLDLPPSIPTARAGDARRLQQVLRQLLSNAVKFTASGTITLTVRDGEAVNEVVFTLEDTGLGIDDEQMQKIFRPFSQVDDSSRRRFGGAGLGLAIAHGLVDAMGGEVGVESRLGRGSKFWFSAPLDPARRDHPPPQTVGLPAVDAPLRALVVDDHAVNRELAATFMQALGFEVVCVENGRQAVEAVQGSWFDMILMDLHMPVLDGLEATREIRRLPGGRGQIPVIALTASASDDAIRECREVGMTAHLAKPIRGEALAAALQDALAG